MAIRVQLLTNTTPESWLSGQTKWDLAASVAKNHFRQLRHSVVLRNGSRFENW
jgi:plasmid maintenance system antidote protein VapI